MLDRRQILIGIGSNMLLPALPARAAIARSGSLRAAAASAYLYTLPLIESATARAAVIAGGTPVNSLSRLRQPTTPATQRITTPNNDTLIARAWVDLDSGPVRVVLPPTKERYVSVAMMDMYSNNFAVLGSRTTGPDGGTFTVVGPNAAAAPGAIRSPTRWMWVLIRLLTQGGEDLAAARAIQDRFSIEAPTWRGVLPTYPDRNADWKAYFTGASRLMRENLPPPTDIGVLRRLAPLGLDHFDPGRFGTDEVAEIEAGVADAKRQLLAGTAHGHTIDGWTYPRSTLGDFQQDYAYRAQIALNGFAALPVAEAVYLAATGPSGDMRLDSAGKWRLRLPGDRLPPVDAFWSLTMYRATPDGQFFLFDNAMQRYSIGDRTQGITRTADGGIDILMQRDRPLGALAANWLPAPSDAPFGLIFRAYCPRPPILDGTWRLPTPERLA